jgi:hypothetical protein
LEPHGLRGKQEIESAKSTVHGLDTLSRPKTLAFPAFGTVTVTGSLPFPSTGPKATPPSVGAVIRWSVQCNMSVLCWKICVVSTHEEWSRLKLKTKSPPEAEMPGSTAMDG